MEAVCLFLLPGKGGNNLFCYFLLCLLVCYLSNSKEQKKWLFFTCRVMQHWFFFAAFSKAEVISRTDLNAQMLCLCAAVQDATVESLWCIYLQHCFTCLLLFFFFFFVGMAR